MARSIALKASWLTLLLKPATVDAASAFWTYTSRFAESTSTSIYTYFDGDVTTYTDPATRTIKSGVTPTISPTSVSTYGTRYNDNLNLIYAYYAQDAVAASDLEPDYYATTSEETSTSTKTTYTYFSMAVTYTAPVTCTTSFTWTGAESVDVPTEVQDQVTPTSCSTDSYYADSTYAFETCYLPSGAAPLTTTSAYYYSEYISSCTTPYAYATGGGGSGGYTSGGGSSSNIEVCSWYSGCTSLKTWVIIIASIIPSLFVLGFIESWFWFRRLMLGKGCLRFGTICWIMISLWVACFTRSQSARSTDDQKLLREKWNQMGSGQAFKMWWKWGFRHAYPVPLLGQYSRNTVGIVPEGQPLPQMGQVQSMYAGGPPPPGAPGAPGAMYPSGVPQGQVYYPPPQGWSPGPQGQMYPVPPPGQAYMMPQNGMPMYYGNQFEQNKEAPNVTETTLTPPSQAPHPVPSPPAPTLSPPANAAEAPSPVSPQMQPAQLPTPEQHPAQPQTHPGIPPQSRADVS